MAEKTYSNVGQFDGLAKGKYGGNIEIYEIRGRSAVMEDDIFFRGTLAECEEFLDKLDPEGTSDKKIWCCQYTLLDRYEVIT